MQLTFKVTLFISSLLYAIFTLSLGSMADPSPSLIAPISYPDPVGVEVGPTLVATGEVFPTYVDLEVPGRGLPFVFSRTYRWRFFQDIEGARISPIDEDWTHSYNWWAEVFVQQGNRFVRIFTGDGMVELFDDEPSPPDPEPGVRAKLEWLNNDPNSNTLYYTTKDQIRYTFFEHRTFASSNRILQLIEIKEPPHDDDDANTITLHYDTTTGGYGDQTWEQARTYKLKAVEDTLGRIAFFTYNAHVLEKLEFGTGTPDGVDPPAFYTVEYPNLGEVRYHLDDEDDPRYDPAEPWLKTTYTYETDEQLLTVTDPSGVITHYTYYPDGQPHEDKVAEIKVEEGGETVLRCFDYEVQGLPGNPTVVHTLEGVVETNKLRYKINTDGDVDDVENQDGVTTRSWWDAARNRTWVGTDNGSEYVKLTKYEYQTGNTRGNVTAEIEYDPASVVYDSGPDPPTGGTELRRTSFVYNGDNQVTKKTDPMAHETDYVYFSATHLKLQSVTETMSGDQAIELTNDLVTEYTYDAHGVLLTETVKMEDGQPDKVTEYKYTNYNGKTNAFLTKVENSVTDFDGTNHPIETTYGYDLDRGLGTRVTDANGVRVDSTYYLDRKLATEVRFSDSRTTEYEYDKSGNLVRREVTDGGTTLFKVEHVYDRLNRLVRTDEYNNDTADLPSTGVGAVYASTFYTYDNRGNLTTLTDAQSFTTSYEYDDLSRLTKLTYHDDDDWIAYEYDKLNQKTREWTSKWASSIADPETIKYEYDDLQRLEQIHYVPTGMEVSFGYDANDNRRTMDTDDPDSETYTYTYRYDQVNRLREEENDLLNRTLIYSYDDASNPRTINIAQNYTVTYGYDEINRLTRVSDVLTGKDATYRYYDAGQLQRVDFPNGAHSAYEIDAANRINAIHHHSVTQGVGSAFRTLNRRADDGTPPPGLSPEPEKREPTPRSPILARFLRDSRIPRAQVLDLEDRIRRFKAVGVRRLKALHQEGRLDPKNPPPRDKQTPPQDPDDPDQ